MPGSAQVDVNDLHSLINKVDSLHLPNEELLQPGWQGDRGGEDEADTPRSTFKVHQDHCTSSSTAANPGSHGYDDDDDNNDDDENENKDKDEKASSLKTAVWQESNYSSNAGTTGSVGTRYSVSSYASFGADPTDQQYIVDDLDEQERRCGPLLVCEFRDICSCPQTFAGHETDAWITHISDQHLSYNFPARSVCWFCSHRVFDSGGGEEDEVKQARRAQAFRKRLKHVARHLVQGPYTYRNMRPDFSLLKHMHRHRLITHENFDFVTSYNESTSRVKPRKQRTIKTRPPS